MYISSVMLYQLSYQAPGNRMVCTRAESDWCGTGYGGYVPRLKHVSCKTVLAVDADQSILCWYCQACSTTTEVLVFPFLTTH